MTLAQFERLVLRLANQTPTRYWKHWNYPCESPWIMAVSFEVDGDRITTELQQDGFYLSGIPSPTGMSLFTIERHEHDDIVETIHLSDPTDAQRKSKMKASSLCLYVMSSSVTCLFGSLALMMFGHTEWSLVLGYHLSILFISIAVTAIGIYAGIARASMCRP